MVAVGHVVGGRFRIQARAGAGGSGVVYRAFDQLEQRDVALKLLHRSGPLDRVRFEREIHILSETDDACVARYVAHGLDTEGGEFLAMEWLEGETLATTLGREPLTLSDAIDLGVVLAETVGRLHARSILHRDLKPGNVFVVDRDVTRIKLLDFGIARGGAHTVVTATGAVFGTIGYMSPEQVRGHAAIDHRTDIFSLGCLLFECVTGTLPFDSASPTQWLLDLGLSEAARATDVAAQVPEDLSDVLATMLEKAPTDRYASMVDVARALRAVAPVRSRSPRSQRTPAITRSESRFVSLLLFRDAPPQELGPFVADEVSRHGGVLYESPDAHLLVTFEAPDTAADLARAAVRLALTLTEAGLEAGLVVLSARVTNERGRFNEAMGRASALFQHVGRGMVVVDETTRAMLQGTIASEPLVAGPTEGGASIDVRAFALTGEAHSLRSPRSTCPFVGRHRELTMLLDAFQHAVADRAAEVVLVLGGAGVGKSRLLGEARARLATSPARPTFLVGSAEDAERTASLGLVRSMFRRFLQLPRTMSDAEQVRAELRGKLARYVDATVLEVETDFLSELLLLGPPTGPSSALAAAHADSRLMTDQLARAALRLLSAIRELGPLVVVVEYLHWADSASVALLDRFLESSAHEPVFLLGTGRPEAQERFPNLFAERSVTTIRLRDLLPQAAEQLARSVLPEAAADALVERIVSLGGGNPLFIEELARAVREGHGSELPESVLALNQGRLDRLAERERRFLRAASVFGPRFPRAGVAALLAGDCDTQTIDDLCRRGVVRRDDAHPGEHAFTSLILREVAYATVPDGDRVRAHRRAAEFLESIGDTRALELAFHFELGRAADRAAPWYLRAGRQALAANDLDAAGRCAEKAIGCDGSAATAGAARTLCAEVEDLRWAWPQAEAHAAAAMELVPPGTVLWFIAAQVRMRALSRAGRIPEFTALAGRLRGIEPAPDACNAAVLALANAANSLAVAGVHAARETMDRIDELEARLPEAASGRAWALLARGGLAFASGDLGAYRTLRSEAAERFDSLDDWRKAIEVRGTAAYADILLGRHEPALAALQACIARATEHGMSTVHYLRHNLGFALLQSGRLDEARAALEATLAPLQKNTPHLQRGSLRYLARALVGLGELELAERHARSSLETAERDTARRPSLATVAHVLIARGRAAEALALVEEAARDLEPEAPFEESEMFLRLTLVRARDLAGHREGAREAAQGGRRRLVALAAKIREDDLRRSFLESVPEHAAMARCVEELERRWR